MELYACVGCDVPVQAYMTPSLFPDESGEYTMDVTWVHLYPPITPHDAAPLYQIEE